MRVREREVFMAAYLKDGTLDILGIQYFLTNGFRFPEGEFLPVAYVVSVDEPDFGCEGRPENEVVYATLQAFTLQGVKHYRMEEQGLNQTQLYDDMWVGTRIRKNGDREFGCFREGSQMFHIFDPVIWDQCIEE